MLDAQPLCIFVVMEPQIPLFNDPAGQHITLKDGELVYYPQFFSLQEATSYLQVLTERIPWQQERMKMYGKEVLFPRLMAWYGDAGSNYAFSGNTYTPQAWTEELLQIKERIEPEAGVRFNSVLLNRYRNGKDSMGWHADDEPELGLNPVIASVNLGASRRFMLRHPQAGLKYELDLQHGSLLIMKGALQHHWQHQVPKTTKVSGERINLTFRVIQRVR
ncbi:alpha-ketoglutarate-dependent dioxygenase AlkB family protein [Chitinophaga filiformis]|uniref:Alpha-ketoglutarate-dependent dioxygenase AlkB n=1 Tax=Chitinophaga filiformis TaxID=104663 RepID=A0ABY4I6U6_CHIFI|nr:alpha-ketoglutarate-dependent dioxygenase AlkB [Chitinophaga filiformis]UPK70496.1 alpha-ketoglutarate-dependent dioxygenase AlkB [Chitinophaga filiformis]